MTDSTSLNLLCVAIAGIPMFFVAWKISRISDDVDKKHSCPCADCKAQRKNYKEILK